MKQATKRMVSLVGSILLVIAAFIIYFNLTVPTYRTTQELRGEQLGRQAFVDNQKEIIGRVKKLIADYKGSQQIQDLASEALPLSPEVAQALLQLSGLAQNNDLSVQGFTVAVPALQNVVRAQGGAESVIARPVGIVNVQMRSSGSYEDFKSFLKQLETNIRVFDLKSLTFQQAGRPGQSLFNFDIAVAAYYQSR